MAEYKSLYRKWRPKTFADVFGQEHITQILETQVINKKVSHAYLFTGSRGTGKTTCAKILAKAVNCPSPAGGSPCNICEVCTGIESGGIIDVIEIDAASNNGVENIREIREEVAFTPGGTEKKVYIIDEVHMLSTGAFNALLKTLEEPPPHIIFILATTEINKIPATILSRCQRHDFKRIPAEVIARKLKTVCAAENIEIEDRAVNLIARLANGAMRDAESILEVAASGDSSVITADYVCRVAGHFDDLNIIKICECIKNKDAASALSVFWEMYDASLDCASFCASLLEMFRNIQVAKIMAEPGGYISADSGDTAEIIRISRDFDNAELIECYNLAGKVLAELNRYTANKRVAVEMLLCRMCIDTAAGITPSKTDGKFAAYPEIIEETAKENKLAAQYMKGAVCGFDGDNIVITVDSELKAAVLKDNIAVIKKHADKFTGRNCTVSVELQEKAEFSGNGHSIDDIKI
ncbi:MAG: DNA polymerase III subunit gamma/tau [Oscillospiraceae bacterium]|nr:DNA polymerase III subunit gamma/tau [Oscillospiraceae bacterium]